MTTDTSTTPTSAPVPEGAGRTTTGILLPVPSRGLDDAALDAAAEEARARGCGIALAHVVHVAIGVPASSDQVHEVDSSLGEIGRQVLTAASDGLRERLGEDVPVTSQLYFGPVVPTLVERSADAEVVLMPRRDLSRLERLVTSSVSNGVAARAHVPVMSVPPGWRRSPTRPRIVTAAVDHPETSGAAEIGCAIARAAATGAALHVLRAAWLPQPYQGVIFQDQTREEMLADARRELEDATRHLVEGHPEVTVTWDVVWERPVDALVRASHRSELLVLGRRHPSMPVGSHLGPVTRSVLRHSEGPVLVIETGE
jgi:nucleotide-binding universal stress UspA family protein